MSCASEIATILNNDGTLLSYLTGGVVIYGDFGRKGINRTQLPDSFDQVRGFIKPMAVIYETDESVSDFDAMDGAGLFAPTVTPIAIYLYDNGDAGYASIEVAERRIYQLLHTRQIPGGFQALWQNTLKDRRNPNLKDACCNVANYRVFGYRSVT